MGILDSLPMKFVTIIDLSPAGDLIIKTRGGEKFHFVIGANHVNGLANQIDTMLEQPEVQAVTLQLQSR